MRHEQFLTTAIYFGCQMVPLLLTNFKLLWFAVFPFI